MSTTESVIAAQYRASLEMLGAAADACSEELWIDPRHKPPVWRIVYHTLFFTDLYLSETAEAFSPWAKHVAPYESLEPLLPIDGAPYTKADLREYRMQLSAGVEARVAGLDLTGSSGMPWLPFSKLELQFYNIRHIHHHTGQLTTWLREELGREIDWVRTA